MSEDVQRTCCSSALLDPGLDVPTDVLGEVVVDGALDSAFEGVAGSCIRACLVGDPGLLAEGVGAASIDVLRGGGTKGGRGSEGK